MEPTAPPYAAAFDVTPLIFYGIVCTVLCATVPPRFPLWARSAIGGSVGVGAAFGLPFLRGLLGI